MSKTIWGTPGGSLHNQRLQTHLAVGSRYRGFYFTIATKAFGRFVRLRVLCRKPFLHITAGAMYGDVTITPTKGT